MRCGACGTPGGADAKFCAQCGAKLVDRALEAELRQITAIFCDLVGSTEMSTRLDPEDFAEVIRRYQDETVEVLRRYEAEVARYVGDGILIHFGWPEAHDDDPERAVRAALDIAGAVQRLDAEFPQASIAARIGIHTGPALVETSGSARQTALGKTLNIAARVQEVAAPGTVVMTDDTLRLVRGFFVTEDLGPRALKGISEPVLVHRAVQPSGVRSRLTAMRSALTPRVNREPELGLLAELWDRARDASGQTVLIVGEPGVGKSRLVYEFREQVRESAHTWLECRCSSYTQHSAFRPVVDLVDEALGRVGDDLAQRATRIETALQQLGIEDADAVPVLVQAFGLSARPGFSAPAMSAAQQRRRVLQLLTTWALRLSELQPTIVLVEDLQWVDPSSLELFQLLSEQSTRTGLMLIGTARPEFQPEWSTGETLSTIDLQPLPVSEMRTLVRGLAGTRQLPDVVVDHVARQTDGIPLFAEEMAKTVLESGQLLHGVERPELAASLERIDIPASLYDSLMARLDRLSAAKRVAQRAAVIGREFDRDLLEEVAGLDAEVVRHGLARLVEDGLLVRSGDRKAAMYAFRHALIQDAAYRSLLKRHRKELHGGVAQALDRRRAHDHSASSPEQVARHYEAAGQFDHAIARYSDAAGEAARQSAHREALAHLTQAIRLIGQLPDDAQWQALEADLQTALASSLIAIRGYGDPGIERAYERAGDLYERLGDRAKVGYSLAGSSLFYFNHGEVDRGAELAARALAISEQAHDDGLQVLARVQLAVPTFYKGQFRVALAHAEAASASYDRDHHRWLGDRYGTDQGIAAACFAALSLMRLGSPDAALARARAAVELAHALGDPYGIAYALFFETAVHWNRGDARLQEQTAARLLAVAEEQEFELLVGLGRMLRAAARAFTTRDAVHLTELYAGSETAAGTGFRGGVPAFICLVAEAQRAVGLRAEAGQMVAAAVAVSQDSGQRYWDSELHRLNGELLVEAGDTENGEVEIRHAIAIAREQEASWPELRAAHSMCKLLTVRGHAAEGRDLLGPVYERFTEGFSTRELRESAERLGVQVPAPA